MPMYTYRREDGTTFDVRQKFLDEPLTVDPETGQKVVRIVQAAGIIFKGSGFYVNDSKSASKSAISAPPKADSGEAKPDSGSDTSSPTPASSTPTAAAASAAD